ncbi:matrixin family metalloprotease [Lentilactobacillus senioris]|uniref:matrixin family metalloprotease n=1 Tax=Lentilactobacillus senioris TaxID=931534 RepID=UPI002281277B|nr:matrixin family metalloprotease [Lentilactobacillus senioris]MCY9806178.1 matrixin family metalloprotease [Lentilactobacillus senioris]
MKAMKKIAASLLVGMCLPVSVNAATLSSTPNHTWRYAKRSAWYQDRSKSSYYRQIWNRANAIWSKKGFNWKRTTKKVKTTVSTVSSGNQYWVGLTWTRNPSGHYISANKVQLNRTLLSQMKYTKTQRVNVAKHELGHALGLDHNTDSSISVMNPANRYHSVRNCDVVGMKRLYNQRYISGSITRYSVASLLKPNTVSFDYPDGLTNNPQRLCQQSSVIINAQVQSVKDADQYFSWVTLQNVKTVKGKFITNAKVKVAGNSHTLTSGNPLQVGEKVELGLTKVDKHYELVANEYGIFNRS